MLQLEESAPGTIVLRQLLSTDTNRQTLVKYTNTIYLLLVIIFISALHVIDAALDVVVHNLLISRAETASLTSRKKKLPLRDQAREGYVAHQELIASVKMDLLHSKHRTPPNLHHRDNDKRNHDGGT